MRAAIFIDGGYILNQFKNNRVQADLEALPDFLLAPLRKSVQLDLLRCYFYYCAPFVSEPPTEDELRRIEGHEEFEKEIYSFDRWQLRLGKLERRRENGKEYFEQKRVDVLLSVDLVSHAAAGHIQHAILVAGDSDFIPAVEAAKASGVTMTVWCGAFNTVHRDLILLADEVHQFNWSEVPNLRPEKPKPIRNRRPPRGPRTEYQKNPGEEGLSLSQRLRSKLKL